MAVGSEGAWTDCTGNPTSGIVGYAIGQRSTPRHLQVEKLDVTNDGDRRKALSWNVEILVNNAGVLEGGSVVDIPAFNIRREFEVNVVGPLLLTQGIAKQMVKRGKGRIVWVSSREGLNVNPFTGIYSA